MVIADDCGGGEGGGLEAGTVRGKCMSEAVHAFMSVCEKHVPYPTP